MHEYHIVEALVKQILESAKNNRASKVAKVNLALGELSGLEASSIQLYFENIAKGTLAEGAQLCIKKSPDAGPGLYIENIEIKS